MDRRAMLRLLKADIDQASYYLGKARATLKRLGGREHLIKRVDKVPEELEAILKEAETQEKG